MNPELREALMAACAEVGILFRDVPVDGRWHAADIEGDFRGRGDGRIKLFLDGAGGVVCNWKGEILVFFADGHPLSEEERAERDRRRLESWQQAKEEEGRRRADAARKARAIWKAAEPVRADHPYLARKGISPVSTLREIGKNEVVTILGYAPRSKGALLKGRLVIAPVKVGDALTTLEMIDETGRKSAVAGGVKTGGYWAAQPLPEGDGEGLSFLIGEGVATVLSAKEAMPEYLAIAALCCLNLPRVAEFIRGKFPRARIIILADVGRGQSNAETAAKLVGCLLVIPEFPNGRAGTDINDLAQVAGLDEVRRQLMAAIFVGSVAFVPGGAVAKDSDVSIWEDPVLFGEIETPEIPAGILPGWLGEYAAAVSEATQTPPGLAAMLALSVTATCLQKRFRVSPCGDEYQEPVNLWTVTALPPASRKTAVVSALTAPLEIWEKEEAERLAPEIRRVNIRRAADLKRIERLTKKAADCDERTERERLLTEIAEVEKGTPAEMRPPRLWTGDVTPERLQMLMAEHGERMALLADEGGIFEVMAGLYNDGRANLDVFLQAHAGKSVRVDRAGRNAFLEAPALTFGLAVQPAVIADFSQGSKRRFRGNGALARFLFCLPRNNIGLRDVRRRVSIPESIKARYAAGIVALLDLPPLVDGAGRERPRVLTLDADALDSWLTFSQFIESNQGPNGEFEPIQDWTGKLPGAALRIAGIFQVAEHGPVAPVIGQHTMERALDLCELLIAHAKAAFDLMGADQTTGDAKAVFRWIMERGEIAFTRRDCHNALQGRFAKVERLVCALEVLQQRAIISEPDKESTGGRPSVVYRVNPALFQGESR